MRNLEIRSWDDITKALAILGWLKQQQSYIEIQMNLTDHIISALRGLPKSKEAFSPPPLDLPEVEDSEELPQ